MNETSIITKIRNLFQKPIVRDLSLIHIEVFGQIGEGISKAGGGGDVHVHVNAMDAQSFMGWLEASGGQTIRQFLVDNNREFTSTAGTW